MELQLLDAVNAERARQRVPPLLWHEGAAAAARAHSRAMAEQHFFSHVDPKRGDARTRLKAAGVGWRAIGENIYMQKGYRNPVPRAIQGWLQSPGHRRNLLNRLYSHTGLGAATGPDGAQYFTQLFLVPAVTDQ